MQSSVVDHEETYIIRMVDLKWAGQSAVCISRIALALVTDVSAKAFRS